MPYRSARQRAWMHIHKPNIARRWDKKYGGKIVPKVSKKKKAVKKRTRKTRRKR